MIRAYIVVETLDGKRLVGESHQFSEEEFDSVAGEILSLISNGLSLRVPLPDGSQVYIPRDNVSLVYLKQVD